MTGAVADALLGAAGLRVPGEPGRPHGAEADREGAAWTGHEATDRLRDAVHRIEAENYQVVNVDVVLPGAGAGSTAPALDDRLRELRPVVAEALHVPPGAVSLRATDTAGGLLWPASGREAAGTDGRAGGRFTALAVALLDRMADIDALHASLRAGG